MPTNSCPVEPLVSSEYCKLLLCPECGIIYFNLPYRISFQFEIHQFLGIAQTFNKAVQVLNGKSVLRQNTKNNAVNRKH